ncbi:MAG: hypothetical protein SGPRY_008296 [Prymnesium sp.]
MGPMAMEAVVGNDEHAAEECEECDVRSGLTPQEGGPLLGEGGRGQKRGRGRPGVREGEGGEPPSDAICEGREWQADESGALAGQSYTRTEKQPLLGGLSHSPDVQRGVGSEGPPGRLQRVCQRAGVSTSSRKRALVLFAGRRRRGSLGEALARAGWVVDEVDTKVGGVKHDLSREQTREAILGAVEDACYDLVWLMGTPCASFSVLMHLDGKQERLLSRREPEGVTPVAGRWRAYLQKHNSFVQFSAAVAEAARGVGATYVVENPVDRGMKQSPHFRWRSGSRSPCG